MVDQDVVRRWKESARAEWESARVLQEHGHHAQTLFHCHLSVEKILKAIYIEENDTEPPYSHNLVVLARKLLRTWTAEEELDLGKLSQYCEQSRYGDELWARDAATAQSSAYWLDRSKYFLSLFP